MRYKLQARVEWPRVLSVLRISAYGVTTHSVSEAFCVTIVLLPA